MAEYLRPATLSSALEALNVTPWSVLAGGTDFYPARVVRVLDEDVLDISALRELRSIEAFPNHWRLGALTTWTDIIRADLPPMFDGLNLAAREVGGVQIHNLRSRGTRERVGVLVLRVLRQAGGAASGGSEAWEPARCRRHQRGVR